MQARVGGVTYDLTQEQVIEAMSNAAAEPIQKHAVDVGGRLFPPKQVFAAVTDRPRQTFTTMEAQRVLSRLGFECRRSEQPSDGKRAEVAAVEPTGSGSRDDARIAALEAAVATMQAAIAGLHTRVSDLEAAR
jgi:uncharacterized coiled-coil protein SlyX